MANFGQGDEVVSKPTAAPTKSSWGSDDEVVTKSKQDVTSSTKEGWTPPSDAVETKAAFGKYPRPGMEPGKATPTVSALGAFGASAVEGVAATPGVMAGARIGASLMPPVAPVLGPLSKPAGALAGGIVGGFAASKVIKITEQFADTVFGTNISGVREQQEKEHPYASLFGQVAGGSFNPLMRPGLPSSISQGVTGSGIMTVVGATQRAIQGGDPFDPVAMTVDATAGAFTKATKLGERMLGQAAAPIDMSAGKKPDVTSNVQPPPGISKEEFIAGLEKNKKQKDSKIPLVETAIKDKSTGEITKLGPKHPESIKASTIDTHDQGFVDEQGNFLDRKEAWNRATDTGQVAKDQKPTVMGEGLHSGDLRAAGDDRFKLVNIPNSVEGIPIVENKNITRKATGEKIGGKLRRDAEGNPLRIDIDVDHLYQQFEDKPWTTPKVEGVEPLPENTFKTPQEWVDFVIQHEAEHVKTPIKEGQTRGGYEDQTNKAALKTLDERKAATGSTGVPKEVVTWETIKPGQKVTLYRGEDKNVLGGEWWTTKKDVAEKFGNVTEVTLPSEVIGKHSVQGHGGSHEFVFPTEGKRPTDLVSIKPEPVVDRTKTSPRDIKDEQEFNEIAQEIYEKHGEVEAVKFFEGYQEYKKTWGDAVGEVEKFVGTNLNSKEDNERIIHNNTSDLKEMAGKDVDLEKLSFDIDKGETLVGKAKEIADKFRQLMNDLGKRALEKGVINGWHEDYVARNVVTEGAAPPGALEQFLKDAFGYGEVASEGGTKTTTKYGEQRKLKTREDLTIHLNGINKWLADNGKDYRFKLKSNNLAEIYKDYALSVEKAIENKNLIENIKQIRNENGESLIKPIAAGENLPYGWKTMDNSALAGYAIHQDLVPHLKFVFDSSPGNLMKALGGISNFVKRINVIGSFFHAKSLMEVHSSANIPIWSPIKDAIVLPLVEKGIKAFTGKDIQLSAISKAVEQFRKGGLGSSVSRWIREDGLQLGVPEDVSQGILTATGKLADTLIGKFGPKTRILEKSLSTVEKYTLGYFDKYTWDYLHTGIKLSTAEAYLDKARMQASKEGKPFDEAAHRKEIAKYLNEAGGGLNWYQAALDSRTEFGKRVALAAYSPEGRRALQTILFAPDWTVSTVRAFSSALPKDLNPTTWHPVEGIKGLAVPTTKGDYARLYQFKTALTYFTLLNVFNMMTANRPIWENKDPTRIEFPDGTSMQAMKHAMEPYHWISDPDKTLSNKLGFIPKAAIIGIGGLEYASPNAPKLVDRSALSRLGAAAKSIAPFQVQAAMDAPKGEGVKRALLGTAGLPIYGADADTRKAQRAERELATKEQAWNYRDKEIKAGRMDWTPKHDKEKERLDKRREKLEQSK